MSSAVCFVCLTCLSTKKNIDGDECGNCGDPLRIRNAYKEVEFAVCKSDGVSFEETIVLKYAFFYYKSGGCVLFEKDGMIMAKGYVRKFIKGHVISYIDSSNKLFAISIDSDFPLFDIFSCII